MAKAAPATCVTEICVSEIGKAAGTVWTVLTEKGPMNVASLVKAVGEPRDNVMQAIGWLAREDKLAFTDNGRKRVISLRP
jgi:hypothetical protein